MMFSSMYRILSYLDSLWEGGYATVLLYLRYQSALGHQTLLDPGPSGSVWLNLQESGSQSSTRVWNHPRGAQTIPYLKRKHLVYHKATH